MRKYNPTSHPKLYHLSIDNHDGEIFFPRIPSSYEEENQTIPRVCVSTSIIGCLRAIDPGRWNPYIEYYVHVPENIDELYNTLSVKSPNMKDVPDVDITKEKWIVKPTRFYCIGLIRSDNHIYSEKGRFHWIKKF